MEKEELNLKPVNLLGYQSTKEFYSPSYEFKDDTGFINPDFRTTLYWNPKVSIDDRGKSGFEFYTGESFTTYSVVIEGLTNDGRIVQLEEKIVGKGVD